MTTLQLALLGAGIVFAGITFLPLKRMYLIHVFNVFWCLLWEVIELSQEKYRWSVVFVCIMLWQFHILRRNRRRATV